MLLLFALAILPLTQPADPCGARRVASGAAAFVAAMPVRARDTIVVAVVCVRHASDVKIGSYLGDLMYDTTDVRVVDVTHPSGGMRAQNARDGGRIRFAGADPQGFTEGALLRATLRLRKPGRTPKFTLRMRELNSTGGANLMPGAPRT